MPEIVTQRVLQKGIKNLRNDPDAFNMIFHQFLCEELNSDYGMAYIDKIRDWFFKTKIPVVQAWSFNPSRMPCFSIHLANEAEDEQKAALGDYWGHSEDDEITTGVFTVFVDIGIHAPKNGDQVLWLYYIMAYILFKEKRVAEKLGMELHTWSASDYNKNSQYMADNVWTRWVRLRCTTQNYLDDAERTVTGPVEVNVETEVARRESPGDLDIDV